jgi:glycerol-3-phosphate dehydrogenase
MPVPARLDRDARAQAWQRLATTTFDVLVVGGGVTGSGAALDAATRGLSVAMVEARDFASGTSSRSSKLFHGGLRYLEQLNFGLVREALHERELMLTRIAPHLVKPVSFLYPLQHRVWERPYVGAGMTLYDLMSGTNRSVPHHRHFTRGGALRKVPALKRTALTGALMYYDAQADDARHTLMVARTAATYGATILNSAEVVKLNRAGERIVGARVRDVETREEVDVRASVVVNCTGVWTDDIQTLAGGRGRFHVRASKGVHIVVPRDRINSETGLILRTEKSVLFVIPWGRHWIIGTTDTEWELDRAHPAASRSDIDYVLDHVNAVLSVPLTREDVEGVYAGLRPLLSGESEETSKLSREHVVAHPVPGLVMVAGGKYTTYRVMAKDAVDAVAHGLDQRVPPSCTDRVPLSGAEGYQALWNSRQRLAHSSGLHVARIEHLLQRYGSMIDEILALIEQDPSLGKPLTGADDYLRAEVVYAASNEGARHVNDVLTRRTRISIETFHRGLDVVEEVAELLAGPLGWDNEQVKSEVKYYTKRVEAERLSQEQDTDQEADAIRLGAPEIVPVAGPDPKLV